MFSAHSLFRKCRKQQGEAGGKPAYPGDIRNRPFERCISNSASEEKGDQDPTLAFLIDLPTLKLVSGIFPEVISIFNGVLSSLKY